MQLFTEEYLEHHGVLGQKWGVRRFQNKDGSLTSAGKKHVAAENKKKPAEESHEDYKSARNKSVKQMSNTELKKAYDRLQLENMYRTEYSKQHTETPKEYVKRVAVSAVKKHGEKVAEYMVGKAINKAFGAEVISGLAKKENVDAGKKLADTIKAEVDKQMKAAQQDNSKNAPMDATYEKVGKSKEKTSTKDSNMKWAKWQNDYRDTPEPQPKVYEGEIVENYRPTETALVVRDRRR